MRDRRPAFQMHAERGEFHITCDAEAMDLDAVHGFLTQSYWAEGISRELVARAVGGSLPFGLFHGAAQIGFARVVTDRATYGYLADVLDAYRGRGLGRWLVEVVMAHPEGRRILERALSS